MQVEAYRRAEVSGICPWTFFEFGDDMFEIIKQLYRQIVAIPKERDWRFYSGDKVRRSLTVHNDTFQERDLWLLWSLKGDWGKELGGNLYLGTLFPGEVRKVELDMMMPAVDSKADGILSIELVEGGERVYRDERKVIIFHSPSLSMSPNIKAFLYDPSGITAKILRRAGFKPYPIQSLQDIPSDCDILIIGSDAFKKGGVGSQRLEGWRTRP